METIRYFHQPTISESLGNGWYVMKKYFLLLLLVVIICSLFNSPSRFTFNKDTDFSKYIFAMGYLALLATVIFFMIKPIISYGASLIFLHSVRDREPDIKLLFVGFQKNYLNIILASFLNFIIVILGLVLLIIPGIVFACRLAFVPYLVMDKELDPVKAVEESWRLTRGYGWTIFGLGLMAIPIVIAGLICLIVGIFPALIWINASFASLYQAVSFIKEKDESPQINPII